MTLPVQSIVDPTGIYTGPINYTVTARSKAETQNYAVYAFDNLEFGKFELNGGLRYENNKAAFRALPLAFYPPGTVPLTAAARSAAAATFRKASSRSSFSARVTILPRSS